MIPCWKNVFDILDYEISIHYGIAFQLLVFISISMWLLSFNLTQTWFASYFYWMELLQREGYFCSVIGNIPPSHQSRARLLDSSKTLENWSFLRFNQNWDTHCPKCLHSLQSTQPTFGVRTQDPLAKPLLGAVGPSGRAGHHCSPSMLFVPRAGPRFLAPYPQPLEVFCPWTIWSYTSGIFYLGTQAFLLSGQKKI